MDANKIDVQHVKVSDLTLDDRNANRGTERGLAMLESSLSRYGVGRGIVTDKNLRVIGGNKTVESLVDLGIEDAVVVSTSGNTLVINRRVDLDLLSDTAARELAYADNRVGQINLDFDVNLLFDDLTSNGLDLTPFWNDDEIEDIKAIVDSLTLDDLSKEYDVQDDSIFWPVVRLKIAPDIYALYRELIRSKGGETEAEKFSALIKDMHSMMFGATSPGDGPASSP